MRRVLPLIAFLVSVQTGAAQLATSDGTGVNVRALDKLTGQVADLTIPNSQSATIGRINIAVSECRYPQGNPAGEAYAALTITEVGAEGPVFQGWMIASSPALNPMDHARYDVWVLRCTTS